MSQSNNFIIAHGALFERKMLNWLNRFNIFSYTHNGGFLPPNGFRNLVAAGVKNVFYPKNFEEVKDILQQHPTWLFGHFNFEFQHPFPHTTPDNTGFPIACLFEPEVLLSIENNVCSVLMANTSSDIIFDQIQSSSDEIPAAPKEKINVHASMTREEYLKALHQVKHHIQRGDCYELNYCQSFISDTKVSPLWLFHQLSSIAPNPFSVYYKHHHNYCVCASPERFLSKTGLELCSQPIKGTAPRSAYTNVDEQTKLMLMNSQKDKSENVMVVDMVRHDLNAMCESGSVKVDALFEVRSYPNVHQMVSTIKGKLKPGLNAADALAATFPMGSMTGAPKYRVLELTTAYEQSQRGLYSGTMGYFTPEGDMDFNVVIRSVFIDEMKNQMSFWAGGGITTLSDPEQEYEESLLKTKSILKALGAD